MVARSIRVWSVPAVVALAEIICGRNAQLRGRGDARGARTGNGMPFELFVSPTRALQLAATTTPAAKLAAICNPKCRAQVAPCGTPRVLGYCNTGTGTHAWSYFGFSEKEI